MGMLRDEVRLFEKLSGESANDVTIERLGSFLDGYFVGKEESVAHGIWERSYKDGIPIMTCTNCGAVYRYLVWFNPEEHPFCPDCGARMKKEWE